MPAVPASARSYRFAHKPQTATEPALHGPFSSRQLADRNTPADPVTGNQTDSHLIRQVENTYRPASPAS